MTHDYTLDQLRADLASVAFENGADLGAIVETQTLRNGLRTTHGPATLDITLKENYIQIMAQYGTQHGRDTLMALRDKIHSPQQSIAAGAVHKANNLLLFNIYLDPVSDRFRDALGAFLRANSELKEKQVG